MRSLNRFSFVFFDRYVRHSSVIEYGYYMNRFNCNVSSRFFITHHKHGVNMLYCINRLYNFRLFIIPAAFVSFSIDSFVFHDLDQFVLVTCEFSFYYYVEFHLRSCGFCVVRFSYFLDLFSCLFLHGFNIYQRCVFLDSLRVICFFRFHLIQLIRFIPKDYFSNIIGLSEKFEFDHLVDFCVSFFISLYAHPCFHHLFINFKFRSGAVKRPVIACFFDVCLSFFNVCVRSSDFVWSDFFKFHLSNYDVCRFFKYYSLFNFYVDSSSGFHINRRFRAKRNFYRRSICLFHCSLIGYPNCYNYLESNFHCLSGVKYLSYRSIYSNVYLLRRLCTFYSSVVSSSSWGSFDFNKFNFNDYSLFNLFRLLFVLVSEASFFAFADTSVVVKFRLSGSKYRFSDFYHFLFHHMSRRYSISYINAKHTGLRSDDYFFSTRHSIYCRERVLRYPFIQFPSCPLSEAREILPKSVINRKRRRFGLPQE